MQTEPNASNHQQIVKALCDRFQNKPRTCLKVNDSFIGSNPRIINIHNETFSYYHPPQQFKDLDTSKLNAIIPKSGVKLKDITKLDFPQKRRKEKNFFTITFPKNKTLKYDKTNKEIIIDSEAKGMQQWTFEFPYDIVVKPEIERRQRSAEQKRRDNEEKKRDKELKDKMHREREEQERIKQEQENQAQFEKFLNQKHILSQEEEFKKNEEKEKRRLEKERMIDTEEVKTEDKPFEESFNDFYEKTHKKQLKQLLELEFNILKIIGDFRKQSIESVKFLVKRFLSDRETKQYRYGDSPNVFKYNDIIVKLGDKDINQEFLNMANIADVSSVLYRTNLENNMRVPLACFVKYRNYKCLCTCISFEKNQDYELTYGLHDEVTLKLNSIITEKLKVVCKELNLKPYQTELNQTKQLIYLDPRLRVYKNRAKFEDFYYVTNLREVFPIDVDLEKNVDQRTVRMRPEYVHSIYNNQPLSGGAFLYSIEDPDGEEEDVQVGKASYLLSHQVIPKFVQKLDNLDILIIDSISLTQALQVNGVNIRYIGKIAKLTTLPYIKQSMIVQGIARSIKTLFRKQVKEYTQEQFKLTYKPGSSYSSKDEINEEAMSSFDNICREVIVDFMNLIFSSTVQSKVYWADFIKPLCKKKYDIDLEIKPEKGFPDVCAGGLLHAVIYHCGVKLRFDTNVKLFNSERPFKLNDWEGYTVSSKVYEFPSFEIQKLARKSKEYLDNKFNDLAIKALDLELAIERALRSSEEPQHCALPEQQILVKLSSLVNVKTSAFPAYHPSTLQYYLNNVKEDEFVKTYNIIQFSLPPTHPMFITFYMAYSKIYDKKYLFKSAAIVALRSLGAQHWRTCELLATTENDNVEILKKAWVDGGQNNHEIILTVTKRLEEIGKLNECVEYCEKGIKKLDPPRETTFKALIDLCMRAISVCYTIRNHTYMVQCINTLWKTLQQFDNKNQDVYYDMIGYTLRIQLQKHPRKNFIYKLILIIADKILTNNYKEAVKEGEKIPYSITQILYAGAYDHFPRIKKENRSEILQEILKSSRQVKSHVHWLKYTLSQIDTCYNYLNFANDLFTNFEELTNTNHNEDFDEGMQSLEQLAKLYGQEFFYNALIMNTFTQQG